MDLPTPGTPLMPKRNDLPVCGNMAVSKSSAKQAVVRPGGLQQRDGFGHGTALLSRWALQQPLDQLGRIHPMAFLICSNTSLALTGIGVPGP